MTRRLPRNWGEQIVPPGANQCARCGEDMQQRGEMTKTARGQWVHKACASGGDDE